MIDRVYAIVHSTKKVAYIGRTYKTVEERYAQHLADAAAGRSHKTLAETLRHEPDAYSVIECEASETASEAEWMQRFRDEGYTLLNDTGGNRRAATLRESKEKAWQERPIYVPRTKTGVGLMALTREEWEEWSALPSADERWKWIEERRKSAVAA